MAGGISCEIALRWMPLHLNDEKSTLVQVMACCCQATSHYLSQCWLKSFSDWWLRYLLEKLSSDKCHCTLLMTSQYCFRWWLGAIRHQAITWTSVDPNRCHQMASLGHNVLMSTYPVHRGIWTRPHYVPQHLQPYRYILPHPPLARWRSQARCRNYRGLYDPQARSQPLAQKKLGELGCKE